MPLNKVDKKKLAKDVQLQLEKVREQLKEENIAGETELHLAAAYGYTALVDHLVNGLGMDLLKTKDKHGATALHWAAVMGQIEMARHLVKLGPDKEVLYAKDNEGRTALHEAAAYGETKMAFLFKELGMDLNVRDKVGRTALHEAAVHGQIEMARYLVRVLKMYVNVQDQSGGTALHEAAFYGDIKMARCLVEDLLIDVNVRDIVNGTAMQWADSSGKKEMVSYLSKKTGQQIAPGNTQRISTYRKPEQPQYIEQYTTATSGGEYIMQQVEKKAKEVVESSLYGIPKYDDSRKYVEVKLNKLIYDQATNNEEFRRYFFITPKELLVKFLSANLKGKGFIKEGGCITGPYVPKKAILDHEKADKNLAEVLSKCATDVLAQKDEKNAGAVKSGQKTVALSEQFL